MCGQAKLRVGSKKLDKKTMRSAMGTKLKDLKHSLRFNHRSRRRLETELLTELGGKGYKLREKVKSIKKIIKIEKGDQEAKYAVKIEHYKKKQCEENNNNWVGEGMH